MIVIPMAGNSRRFFEAGYTRPKYELPVGNETLFALTVRSFERYFDDERFVFVCRRDLGAEAFVRAECERLAIRQWQVAALAAPTRGQAETVLLGLEHAGYRASEALLIFNIDTIRHGYRFPAECDWADAYLEVFSGPGDHWSFVEPAAAFTRRVARTTE
jgi:CTP:molybdopterin cytidylyltransferase MocA